MNNLENYMVHAILKLDNIEILKKDVKLYL
jgi:hypothetical protein